MPLAFESLTTHHDLQRLAVKAELFPPAYQQLGVGGMQGGEGGLLALGVHWICVCPAWSGLSISHMLRVLMQWSRNVLDLARAFLLSFQDAQCGVAVSLPLLSSLVQPICGMVRPSRTVAVARLPLLLS